MRHCGAVRNAGKQAEERLAHRDASALLQHALLDFSSCVCRQKQPRGHGCTLDTPSVSTALPEATVDSPQKTAPKNFLSNVFQTWLEILRWLLSRKHTFISQKNLAFEDSWQMGFYSMGAGLRDTSWMCGVLSTACPMFE